VSVLAIGARYVGKKGVSTFITKTSQKTTIILIT